MEKNLYKIRFWVPYCDYTHIIDVDEFMNGVFGETAPRFYFECYIHDRLHECYIDVKEMTLTITPIEDDGETLMVDCRETFDDRFWIIEMV